MAIDQYLDANVPNWRAINADPRFHSWLLMPDTYSGVIRDRLLKDAVAKADAGRLINFFKGFLGKKEPQAKLPRAPLRNEPLVERRPANQFTLATKSRRCGTDVVRAKSTTKVGPDGNTN